MKLTLIDSESSELLMQWDLKEELLPDVEPGTFTQASWQSLLLDIKDEVKRAIVLHKAK